MDFQIATVDCLLSTPAPTRLLGGEKIRTRHPELILAHDFAALHRHLGRSFGIDPQRHLLPRRPSKGVAFLVAERNTGQS